MTEHLDRQAAALADGGERPHPRLWRQGQRPDVAAFLASVGPLAALEAAAVLRADQRERWSAGQRVPAEDYLAAAPAVRDDPEAALDLIYGEFLLRQEAGENPDLSEFQRRFPGHAATLGLQVQLHGA